MAETPTLFVCHGDDGGPQWVTVAAPAQASIRMHSRTDVRCMRLPLVPLNVAAQVIEAREDR